MRILVDIGHPAHVHLFKNFAWEMQIKGHNVFFTCREKEYEIELLEHYGFEYKSFGKKYNTSFGKLIGLVKFDIMEFIEGLKFRPDILFSHGSMYAAHAALLLRKPHIAMEDTGNHEQIKMYLPFTDVVLTPDVLHSELGHKQIKYSGYHELAYLHPNRYSNNKSNGDNHPGFEEDYALIRFVSWNATHDMGQQGFSKIQKDKLVAYLSSKMKVVISSEGELPENYKKYKYKLNPEGLHDFLAGAKIFIGEGATMTSEAGILGIPAIYVNSQLSSYNEDQEKYGLVYNFRNGKNVLVKIDEILKIHNLKDEWQKRRNKMLDDKIDVTAFMVWFVENYPESFKIMKENPDYQYKFKR
jgi:uncharacterized protein